LSEQTEQAYITLSLRTKPKVFPDHDMSAAQLLY
jgi:hypothetical protein